MPWSGCHLSGLLVVLQGFSRMPTVNSAPIIWSMAFLDFWPLSRKAMSNQVSRSPLFRLLRKYLRWIDLSWIITGLDTWCFFSANAPFQSSTQTRYCENPAWRTYSICKLWVATKNIAIDFWSEKPTKSCEPACGYITIPMMVTMTPSFAELRKCMACTSEKSACVGIRYWRRMRTYLPVSNLISTVCRATLL